jgi:hypothetical protein
MRAPIRIVMEVRRLQTTASSMADTRGLVESPIRQSFLSGKLQKNLKANEVIWEFFAKHSR